MIVWRWLAALLLVTAGAISLVEGIAPAHGAHRLSRADGRTRTTVDPNSLRSGVERRGMPTRTKAAVEVVGADPATLEGPRAVRDDARPLDFVSCRPGRCGQRKLAWPRTSSPLGSYRVDGDIIRFEPRFPLEPG